MVLTPQQIEEVTTFLQRHTLPMRKTQRVVVADGVVTLYDAQGSPIASMTEADYEDLLRYKEST